MIETDIQYRCFYVEEDISTLPRAPMECSRMKRKSADAKSMPSNKKQKEMVCNSIIVQHWFILHNFKKSDATYGHGRFEETSRQGY